MGHSAAPQDAGTCAAMGLSTSPDLSPGITHGKAAYMGYLSIGSHPEHPQGPPSIQASTGCMGSSGIGQSPVEMEVPLFYPPTAGQQLDHQLGVGDVGAAHSSPTDASALLRVHAGHGVWGIEVGDVLGPFHPLFHWGRYWPFALAVMPHKHRTGWRRRVHPTWMIHLCLPHQP